MKLSVRDLLLFEESKERFNYSFNKSFLFHINASEGKTSLVHALIGNIIPFEGAVLLDERVVCSSEMVNLFRSNEIGVIFNKHALISNLTIFENLELTLAHKCSLMSALLRKDLILEHLEACALVHLSRKRPCELSSSQTKVIAFMRGVITNPKLLIWDDPYTSSDVTIERYFIEEMKKREDSGGIVIALSSDVSIAKKLGLEVVPLSHLRKSA